jgi:hypothetical protein
MGWSPSGWHRLVAATKEERKGRKGRKDRKDRKGKTKVFFAYSAPFAFFALK